MPCLSGEIATWDVVLEPRQAGLVDWLYRNGEVVRREDHEDGSLQLWIKTTDAMRQEIEERLGRNGAQ